MHGPAVYAISVLLFVLAGVLLFAAGSSWAKVARHKNRTDGQPGAPTLDVRAAAGLTAAALILLGAALLWAAAVALFLNV